MTNAVNIAGLGAALTVTSGVVNFSSTPTVNSSPIGASAATPTALGTVYGKMDTASYAFTGYQAGNSNTSGNSNTAMGYQASYSCTTNSSNSAFGYTALYSNTADYNSAYGVYSLNANTTGSSNTAYGAISLRSNTTGSYNVAVGMQAAYGLTTKTHNVAIGYQALYNTNEDANVAVGSFSLTTNSSGYYNTAMGYESLKALTTGNQNTAVGFQAGVAMTSGGSNTLIGNNTGASLTTGNVNTFVGRYAGQVFTTGSYNTHIGYATNGSGAGQGSEIVISGGPSGATGKGGDTGFITPNGGPMFQGNNAGSWSTVSDRRLKKNIVDNNEGLNKIAQIQVRNFEYRIEEEITDLPKEQVIKKTGVQFGVIAQELQAVLPDCVTEQSTGVLTIDSDNLTWYLINAVKELKAELDALKAKVA